MNCTELSLEEIRQILDETQLRILDMYLERCKQKDIIDSLNVTRGQIDAMVKKYKLTRFRSRNNFTINETKIHLDNPLYWYFIGWFVSDGNIHKTNSNSEIVQFTLKDLEPLQHLKTILGYSGEIKIYNKTVLIKNENNVKVPTERKYYFLGITNKKLVESLKNILNIVYKKTYTIEFPNILNEDCLKMFVRGFWDGDGCFTVNSSNGVKTAAAHCASINFCLQFKKIMSNYDIETYILESGTCPEIRIYRKKDFINFVNWLYSVYPEYSLSRKKDKAFSLIK